MMRVLVRIRSGRSKCFGPLCAGVPEPGPWRCVMVFLVWLGFQLAGLAVGHAWAASGPLLVVAAHPDDEALGFAGIIDWALSAGRSVYVAVVTNGDARRSTSASGYCGAASGTQAATAAYGLRRNRETLAAMNVLGVPRANIFFLGYPNQGMEGTTTALTAIAASQSPWTGDATGLHRTYAEDGDGQIGTCNGDFRYQLSARHSQLYARDLAADMDSLLVRTQPTEIYTHSVIDAHPDHAEVYRQVLAAVKRSGRALTLYTTLIHQEGMWSCKGFADKQWPNPSLASVNNDPYARFTPTLSFTAPPYPTCSTSPTGTSWGSIGTPDRFVEVPSQMQAPSEASNLKWQVISKYTSQISCPSSSSCGYMRAFVKKHEFFWVRKTGIPSGFHARSIDTQCNVCSVLTTPNGEIESTIQSAADASDTAYAVKHLGSSSSGLTGRVYIRDVVRLQRNARLEGDLTIAQMRDTANRVVYELYVESSDSTIRLWSPAGGLRSAAIQVSTEVTLPNDGTKRRIEVSAQANSSVRVRVDGVDEIVISALSGAVTGNQRKLHIGIHRYAGSGTHAIRAYHSRVAVSQSGWVGP